MAGLFTKKKKEDTSSKQQHHQQQQQRPNPSPSNGHTHTAYNGFNDTHHPGGPGGGPKSPTSPSFSQNGFHPNNNSNGFGILPQQQQQQQQLQQQQQPIMGGAGGPPGSPTQLQHPGGSDRGSSQNMLATPQLFWTQRRILGTNPFPRFQHSASITVNGTDIFLYGGNQRGTPKGDLFVIDSVSLQCTPVSPAGAEPPMAKSAHSAVNIGQYIIYFGGWDSVTGQCDDSLHVLHTARKEWNKPPIQGQLPTPRHSHSGCSVGTVMYIFGGQVDNFYLDDIVSFDMKSITHNPRWEKIEPQTESPPARSGHCAAVHEGKIYIFGGADADYFYNDIWCFDTRALTWTPIPASGYLPTGRHGHSCTVAEGVLYIFGGYSPDGTELNDAYAFKIHERRWYLFQSVGPVASARSGHSMCTIKDRIFVLGGESEQTKQEDSAQIYYLEVSKIRFPDSGLQNIPPRQASSGRLVPARPGAGSPQPYQQPLTDSAAVNPSTGYESDRNSGQQQRLPGGPPDRPDRRLTQRPASPATFGPMDRSGSGNNMAISQQTSQLMNPQLGPRPLTGLGVPPPRGASSGFMNGGPGGPPGGPNDYQADGLSVATRRQTMKDDFQGGYGGAVVGSNSMRRPMHQMPATPPLSGSSPSPLRVINVSPSSPPLSARPLPSGESSPTSARSPPPTDRRMNFVSPPAPGSNHFQDEINPYASDSMTSPVNGPAPIAPAAPPVHNSKKDSAGSAMGSYVPPPPSAAPASAPLSTTGTNPPGPIPPPPGARTNLPPPPITPSPPSSGSISHPHPPSHPPPPPSSSGADKRTSGPKPQPPPQLLGSPSPIPGPLDRSSSPALGHHRPSMPPPPPLFRGSSGPLTGLPESPRTSIQDMVKIKSLESKAEAAQDQNEALKAEVEALRKREQWLLTEVMLARSSVTNSQQEKSQGGQERRLSMADLEKEMEKGQWDVQHMKIASALVKVKDELKTAKVSIATQAQAASFKIKEAERIRTGALQEAAYLKAKLSSFSNAQQDPGALARVEMERAANLEKRLTLALNELESLEDQASKSQEMLEQERMSRLSAEERSNGATLLAEEAQTAHTRALAELASLHTRAAKAEADARDFAAQLAESRAGFSGHESQSLGLMQKVADLKRQVEEHQKALERTQMAYSAANERAMRAEDRVDESSARLEQLESLRLDLSNELNRYRGETERLQGKIEEAEGRYKVSKEEVVMLRKLVEEGMGALNLKGPATNIGGRSTAPERKHDSMVILSTVSKVSELEHELGSLKVLHAQSQTSATKSGEELAKAMIELSKLEQSSMQARGETIALQKLLSQERDTNVQLRNELSKTEKSLESHRKQVEDHELQLSLLKDVMREKGLLAEDLLAQAAFRGTDEYASTMEKKVWEAQERVQALEEALEQVRQDSERQLASLEAQRQVTLQHSEKTGLLLRKMKNDLEQTMHEKDLVQGEWMALQKEHALCQEKAAQFSVESRENLKAQEEERVRMLQLHWEQERRVLEGQVTSLQAQLLASESHGSDLSHKVISLTERIQELGSLNEAVSEELEQLQDQMEESKVKVIKQELKLQQERDRLLDEMHHFQEMVEAKQEELNEAFLVNGQLERELEKALKDRDEHEAAVSGARTGGSSREFDRDSVDSITKELEMLKVPWNKTPGTAVISDAAAHPSASPRPSFQQQQSASASPRPSFQQVVASPRPSFQQQQQQQQQSQQYSTSQVQGDNETEEEEEEEEEGDHDDDAFEFAGQASHQNNFYNITDQATATHQFNHAQQQIHPSSGQGNSGGLSPIMSNQSIHNNNHFYGGHPNMNNNNHHHHQNQMYESDSDSDDVDNEDEYLAHLAEQQRMQQLQQEKMMELLHGHGNGGGGGSQQQPEQQQGVVADMGSLNDRSPSRLKEYEQMIDEIEKSAGLH